MALWSFKSCDLETVSDALEIAEDATGNFYKFSIGQWKKHQYDVKTLSSLRGHEISTHAFALLNKNLGLINGSESKTGIYDFYNICLQDHRILQALKRDHELGLLSLLVYIFTHELVHIVRFCNFLKRFEICGEERELEEKTVHTTTFEILKDLSMPKLDYILDSYSEHRAEA
ncbi:MAG: hypothetical protein GY864_03560 [Desulfobacterales bacterium]|nr:hypothetical protein [Desulfobacterales bacterium]